MLDTEGIEKPKALPLSDKENWIEVLNLTDLEIYAVPSAKHQLSKTRVLLILFFLFLTNKSPEIIKVYK